MSANERKHTPITPSPAPIEYVHTSLTRVSLTHGKNDGVRGNYDGIPVRIFFSSLQQRGSLNSTCIHVGARDEKL